MGGRGGGPGGRSVTGCMKGWQGTLVKVECWVGDTMHGTWTHEHSSYEPFAIKCSFESRPQCSYAWLNLESGRRLSKCTAGGGCAKPACSCCGVYCDAAHCRAVKASAILLASLYMQKSESMSPADPYGIHHGVSAIKWCALSLAAKP
jgi:hypothetical protein